MNSMNDLKEKIHANAVEKGFWEDVDIARFTVLCAGELNEGVEAHRIGRIARNIVTESAGLLVYDFDTSTKCTGEVRAMFEAHVKDSLEDEVADTFIRILDLAGGLNIDLDSDDARTGSLDEYDNSIIGCTFHGEVQIVSRGILSLTNPMDTYSTTCYVGAEDCAKFGGVINALYKFSERYSIDLDRHVELKMWYNEGRERLHGKQY